MGQEATVRTRHGTTDWFKIGKGVCLGCILLPCLLNLCAAYITRNFKLDESQAGIKISWRNINSFPGGSAGKESTFNVGSLGLIPESGRSPVEVPDNPLHYSCLKNPMDRGAWQATVHGVAESWTRLGDTAHHKNINFVFQTLYP